MQRSRCMIELKIGAAVPPTRLSPIPPSIWASAIVRLLPLSLTSPKRFAVPTLNTIGPAADERSEMLVRMLKNSFGVAAKAISLAAARFERHMRLGARTT